MNRPMIFAALLAASSLGLNQPVAAQVETAQPAATASAATPTAAGLPARPVPFKFVNDQAGLLTAADVKKLESGLRKYADQNGTQVVVVTVPSLGRRTAADYGRALGTAWGVGQRGKNNGVVVLIAQQERKVAIEAGSGVSDRITADVKRRIIAQNFGPNFKQNNYMAGLRTGLSELMKAANPSSAPAATGAVAAGAAAMGSSSSDNGARTTSPAAAAPLGAAEPARNAVPAEPVSSGPGIGTLLIGALGLGGIFLLVRRLFGGNKSAAQANQANGNGPNFYPNQPNRPTQPTPNFGAPQGPGYGGQAPQQGGGIMGGGMGGILATGAAAAAGAYLGNRMAGGHDAGSAPTNFDNNNPGGNNAGFGTAGAGAAGAAGTGAAGDYFSSRDGGTADNAPDYFSDANTADNSGDYFSSDDNSSYDDTSSSDTGGGGFDGGGGDDSGSF